MQLRRERHPEAVPFFYVGFRRRFRMRVAVVAKLGVALRSGPECIPALLRFVERHTRFVSSVEAAEAGADIHMRLIAERPKLIFDSGILIERLDERANRVKRWHAHFLFQLLIR